MALEWIWRTALKTHQSVKTITGFARVLGFSKIEEVERIGQGNIRYYQFLFKHLPKPYSQDDFPLLRDYDGWENSAVSNVRQLFPWFNAHMNCEDIVAWHLKISIKALQQRAEFQTPLTPKYILELSKLLKAQLNQNALDFSITEDEMNTLVKYWNKTVQRSQSDQLITTCPHLEKENQRQSKTPKSISWNKDRKSTHATQVKPSGTQQPRRSKLLS